MPAYYLVVIRDAQYLITAGITKLESNQETKYVNNKELKY